MTDLSENDLNALSYWFPNLVNADIPVPKTVIVPMCAKAALSVSYLLGGDMLDEKHPELDHFLAEMKKAARIIGYPLFLRTDHTSGKHEFTETCYVKSEEDLPKHIFRLAEFSEMASLFGLPYKNWALRELLPVKTYGTCPAYGNMPIAKEFRVFVNEGTIECYHPYWPLKSLKQGGAEVKDFDDLCKPDNLLTLISLAKRAAKAVPGHWSVDILDTKNGLYVIDMAIAHQSYHWEDCEFHKAEIERMAEHLLHIGL